MNITEEFNKNNYVILKDVLDPASCKTLTEHLFSLVEQQKTVKDDQCPLSDAAYGDQNFDQLLEGLKSVFEDIAGVPLIPTYSYARLYRTGEVLEIHRDRPACEISATLTLGIKGKEWPIFFNREETVDYDIPGIILNVGSAALYKGCEIYHWRDRFEGEWQCQIFLHYVNAEGPYREEAFDRRSQLGIPAENKQNAVFQTSSTPPNYWQFVNVLSEDYCNSVIGKYGCQTLKDGVIGDAEFQAINKEVRNVKNLLLPFHEGIGVHLVGSAFIANQQGWKFDITQCNQVEYLKYDVTGRYKTHVDTVLNTSGDHTCRKLTALAFLNDDFKGGKFYLQISDERIYPTQSKGTIIVFPSFLLHGVEDITEGTRHSVVCWISGPSFR